MNEFGLLEVKKGNQFMKSLRALTILVMVLFSVANTWQARRPFCTASLAEVMVQIQALPAFWLAIAREISSARRCSVVVVLPAETRVAALFLSCTQTRMGLGQKPCSTGSKIQAK